MAFKKKNYFLIISMIKVENSQDNDDQLRLVDDVFAKICYMINDISIEVKVCANSLLVIHFFDVCYAY